jgi:hypothetical protein
MMHSNQPAKNDARQAEIARDEANQRRFVDQSGVEASDLPDGGRPTGHNDTPVDIGRRNLPHQHGGETLDSDADDATGRSEGGLRGSRDLSDASGMPGGGRGKN